MSVLGSTSRNVLRRARVNVRSCAASSATWHAKCIGYSWLLEPLLLPSRGLDRHRSIGGSKRTRRVLEGCLAGAHRWEDRRRAIGIRGRDGLEHLAGACACLGTAWRECALLCTAQPREEHNAPGEHNLLRDGSVRGRSGKHDRCSVRGLCRAGPRPGAAARTGGGDGQPRGAQGRASQGTDQRKRLRGVVLATLLTGPQLDRGSVLEGKGAVKASR